MENVRLIPTANAGAILRLGGLCIWIDVLNEANNGGYEVLSDEHLDRLLCDPSFRPDAILFTHRHRDHYCADRLMRAVESFPDALVYVGGAGPEEKTIRIFTGSGSAVLRTIPLPHDGAAYADVRNDALLLMSAEGNVLIPGDCPVACPELMAALSRIGSETVDDACPEAQKNTILPIGLALLNFPWLCLGKGRKALYTLAPDHVFFFHLPASDHDAVGYRRQADRMRNVYGKDRDWRLIGTLFEEETFLFG